ncbi:MAG: LysR family transcriptional regulator [Oscillospiraceae bacterium]|nr:LysR family transcriptional regulator [Oscillospiraceae bacterium]
MTFQQLREFCAITDYENITMAAKALFVTQPALSMALKNIEEETGTQLFDRRGKNIYLNENGKVFYDFARRTLTEWDVLRERFRVPVLGDTLLRFCYSSDYIPDYVLPAFCASNPNVPITINEISEKLITSFVMNNVYDLAITSFKCDASPEDGLVSRRFYQNRLMVSVPLSNILASKSSLSLKDLNGQKYFRLSKRGEFSSTLDEMARREGINMIVSQRVNYEVIKMQQRNFDFLYFITTLQAEFDYIPVNRKLIPVEGEMFKRDMYLSYMLKNEGKVTPFLDWVNSRLIRRDGSAADIFAEE